MEAEQREEQQQAPEESPPQAQGGDEGAEQPEQQQAGSQEADAEAFVNEGLDIWMERQQQWRAAGASSEDDSTRKRKRAYAPTVTVDQLLSFQPLPHPVPLEEAVELLAELWESDEPF